MAGKKRAVKEMQRYCDQDVTLLAELYGRTLPWLKNTPNRNLYSDSVVPVCPKCGADGSRLTRRGFAETKRARRQRYQCQECRS